MWKQLWKKWTLDKPAAFGDLLWEVFVVQLAAFLDRLTLRRVIAFIPVVILVLAYSHSIPIPPELMLVGDVLAYIDIYSAILLVGLMSRATTILFALKQAAALVARLASNLLAGLQRLDFRHRREGGARRQQKAASRTCNDDEPAVAYGLAWWGRAPGLVPILLVDWLGRIALAFRTFLTYLVEAWPISCTAIGVPYRFDPRAGKGGSAFRIRKREAGGGCDSERALG